MTAPGWVLADSCGAAAADFLVSPWGRRTRAILPWARTWPRGHPWLQGRLGNVTRNGESRKREFVGDNEGPAGVALGRTRGGREDASTQRWDRCQGLLGCLVASVMWWFICGEPRVHPEASPKATPGGASAEVQCPSLS